MSVPQDGNLEVEYDLNVDDAVAWVRYYRAHVQRGGSILFLILLCVLIVVLGASAASAFLQGGDFAFVYWWLPVLIVPGAMLLARRLFSGMLLRTRLSGSAGHRLRQLRRLRIGPEGLTVTTADTFADYYWSAIERLAETSDYAFFYTGQNMAQVLPRRVFDTDEGFHELSARRAPIEMLQKPTTIIRHRPRADPGTLPSATTFRVGPERGLVRETRSRGEELIVNERQPPTVFRRRRACPGGATTDRLDNVLGSRQPAPPLC